MSFIGNLIWLVFGGILGAIGGIGVFFGAWPPLTLALLPAAVALSVGLFYPAWPLFHTPENRARVWVSETGIALLASLIGLIK